MNHMCVFPLGTHIYPGGLRVGFADLNEQKQAADVSVA